MLESINLPEESQFFIAICKSGEHNWVTLGAIDPTNGKKHTLAYYGKRLTYAKDYQCKGRLKTMFGTAPGVLTRDYKFKAARATNKELPFEYKAYDISRDIYIEFAKQMKALLKGKYQEHDPLTKDYHKNQLYYPNPTHPNQFDFVNMEDVPDDERLNAVSLDDDVEQLGIRTNCRHTVLSLLKTFIPNGARLTKGISTFAYQCLPYHALYHQDKIISEFYILPVPPNPLDEDKKRYQMLSILFKRLEKIPKMKAGEQATKEKFIAVKALYDSLAVKDDNQPLSIGDALSRIEHWESRSRAVIDSCRLFRTSHTKTRQMVDDLKAMVQNPIYS